MHIEFQWYHYSKSPRLVSNDSGGSLEYRLLRTSCLHECHKDATKCQERLVTLCRGTKCVWKTIIMGTTAIYGGIRSLCTRFHVGSWTLGSPNRYHGDWNYEVDGDWNHVVDDCIREERCWKSTLYRAFAVCWQGCCKYRHHATRPT